MVMTVENYIGPFTMLRAQVIHGLYDTTAH